MNGSQVKAYFQRIGLDHSAYENRALDSKLLAELHYAHVTTIPFENLDMLRKIPISLETENLFEKIVGRNRGGNCFETNGLSGEFLRALGYGVKDCFSRYFRDAQGVIPMRRHRLLLVETLDGTYFWDVGVGQRSPRHPLRLAEGLVQRQFGETYRFDREPFLGWVLREFHKEEWKPILSFTQEEQDPIDFVAACVWCELSPDSPFHRQEMVALKTKDGRKTIDGTTFRQFCLGEVVEQENLTQQELETVLREEFGLVFS